MRKIIFTGLFVSMLVTLSIFAFPGTGFARVFAVFGPEDFIRSSNGPATEVRQFPVQYPDDADFTLHVFYVGPIKDLKGMVPSAVVTLNGEEVVRPDDFNRNVRYIKKSITLSEGNSLSVELRGKPGSGIRIVITGQNDKPQQFDFLEGVQPDGSNLFGSDLNYFWTIVDKPQGANAMLSYPSSSNPILSVDNTGVYILELRVYSDSWESEPILVTLIATAGAMATFDNPFVPVPVKTRVVTGTGTQYQDYSIKVGSNTYTAPAPASCGSPTNSGFQVLVLDRATLEKRDHKTFNMPCGRNAMYNFLAGLDDTSLVIVSSLYTVEPFNVCFSTGLILCTLLEDFGGTSVLSLLAPGSFTLADGNTVQFSYSLIGIKNLGIFEGIELNNWDHKPLSIGDPLLYSNISGYLVTDTNYPHNRTFVYPEYVEIETRAVVSERSNTVRYGSAECTVSLPSLPSNAVGGFQVVVLDRDTLNAFPWPGSVQSCPPAFATNAGTGTGSVSELEQKRMYDFLNGLPHSDESVRSQQYVVVITSIGSPIGYKSQYFTNLIKLIGNYFGGTVGVLNQLGPTSTYSLIGMTNPPGFLASPYGATDAVETSSSNANLRAVMHKDKEGWFKPVTTAEAAADAIGVPDFSLLSVALQDPTPWPMTDPSDPMFSQYDAAYKYISSHLGTTACPPENPGCTTNVRSRYNENPIDLDQWIYNCGNMLYQPNPDFSEPVFKAMKLQLCGGFDETGNYVNGEFQYVQAVETFTSDLDTLLIYLQLGETADMLNVYNAVKAKVTPPEENNVLYDTGIVIRGLLTAGTSLVTHPGIKGIMGIVNGAMSIAMGVAKKPSGEDNTAVTTDVLNLVNEMDNLWKSCNIGKEIVLGMIKTDWGKLGYVGTKLLGEWSYSDLDKKDWEIITRNALQAYYFQSLMPARWTIDYVLNTKTIVAPKDYGYDAYDDTSIHIDECNPYCEGSSANPDAYWVDQFTDASYSWYVLEDEIVKDTGAFASNCGWVHFSRSVDLRDVLFGSGEWCDSSGCHGQKLNLSEPIFYERWLSKDVYASPLSRVPTAGTNGVAGGYNYICND